jgi:two-component system NtrC family sensor kinase
MFSKEIPGERSPRLQSSLGSSRHDIERFRDLSLELLKYSTQGLLRKDFLPMVSERIMEFSECDALELWVKEDPHKHFRCSVAGSKKMPFGFILVPCPLGEATDSLSASTGAPSMEKLCCNIIKGSIEKPHPCYTGKGSFWTNTADGQTHPLCKERLPGFFSSIAVIPIKLEEECVGLLQLKTRRPGFFSSRDVAFYEDIASILGIAFSHQYAQVELRERIKELTCLYGIARVVAQRDASFDEIMQGIADLLPPAWLFPEIASARIVLNGKSYETQGYGQTPHRQVSDVVVKDEKVGFVEVSYREKKLTMDEGPFLSEERSLINSVAREVAIFYERSKGEEEKALLQDQLRHADRLATIGQLAAGVAHELNEPLGNILGFAQLALKERGLPGQSEKDLRSIESASLHAREIIKKLMAFARQLPPAKVPVDLNDVVNESLYLFEARCAKSGIELVRDLAPNLPEITIDPGQMNQVLVNLVVNAIQAMPKGGSLSVKTRETEEGGCLIVEDTGLGMSEESKKQIFLPFFTTKDINEGTGLGLAVVHGIVSSHGGRITVKTREGEGTRFAIHLPSRGPKQA